jgi:hypothetical protein
MENFTKLRIEVWNDGTSDLIAIHGDREKDAPGLRWVWFMMTKKVFADLIHGKAHSAEDGYHKVTVYGDQWTFYNMDGMPNTKAGIAEIPYYKAWMPGTFMKAVLRLATKIWWLRHNNGLSYEGKTVIEVSAEHRKRSCRLYGQGLGNVRLDFGEYKAEEAEAHWNNLLKNGGDTFRHCAEGRMAMVRNATNGFHQTATLRLYMRNENEFDWQACYPNGKAFYHGGIINHSRDGGHDWSSHS